LSANSGQKGKSPGYIQGFLKTVKSWLRYNNISLTRRIKIKNSTATPTIENEKVPSQEELARFLGYRLRESGLLLL